MICARCGLGMRGSGSNCPVCKKAYHPECLRAHKKQHSEDYVDADVGGEARGVFNKLIPDMLFRDERPNVTRRELIEMGLTAPKRRKRAA